MTGLTHEEAQELLAAYGDEELGDRSRQEVESHLSGCARCRAALSVQQLLHTRVAAEVLPEPSDALRARIRAQLERGAALDQPGMLAQTRTPDQKRRLRASALRRRATVWSGWAVAAGLALYVAAGSFSRAEREPPMVAAALADYRSQVGRELPSNLELASVRERVPFAFEPVQAGGARLLSAWTTTLRDEPVAVFAYRVGDRVVLAYVVSESMFFRQPVVREKVARQGRYTTSQGSESVVAFPRNHSGVLIVGDASVSQLELLRT